jgi:hypothetical protein
MGFMEIHKYTMLCRFVCRTSPINRIVDKPFRQSKHLINRQYSITHKLPWTSFNNTYSIGRPFSTSSLERFSKLSQNRAFSTHRKVPKSESKVDDTIIYVGKLIFEVPIWVSILVSLFILWTTMICFILKMFFGIFGIKCEWCSTPWF